MLLDNVLLSAALQGFNPFQIEKGIFSGGFQGILYPNPTTLVYPGFNPYVYLEDQISPFTPSTTYAGLGAGNPGINYRNAGHLLGIFDTFARMSYGIGGWLSIHAGEDKIGGPSVSFPLPLVNDAFEYALISFGDIYPKFTELPNKWIDTFYVDQFGAVRPSKHNTQVAEISAEDLNSLFGNKSVFSYFGMPQFFRLVMNVLVTSASALSTRNETTFVLDEVEKWQPFNGNNSMLVTLDDRAILTQKGTAYVHCAVNDPIRALKTLTGSSVYHNGVGNQNEFRSLTELNSVINIIPVQMVGGRYITDTHTPIDISIGGGPLVPVFADQTQRVVVVSSFMILDFVINVSDIPDAGGAPGTITIDGETTVLNAIEDTSEFDFFQQERGFPIVNGPFDVTEGEILARFYGPVEFAKKNVKIEMKNDNQFSWDKDWLGVGGPVSDEKIIEDVDVKGVAGDVQDNRDSLERTENEPWITQFSQTFTLGAGCNSIRMRVKIDNFMRIDKSIGLPALFFPLEQFWVPVDDCHLHSIPLLDFELFHCHGPRGAHFNNWAGNPDAIIDNPPENTIAVSFTVTGSNMETMSFEFFV